MSTFYFLRTVLGVTDIFAQCDQFCKGLQESVNEFFFPSKLNEVFRATEC